MQGRNKVLLDIVEEIEAFKGKMKLWISRMEKGKIAAFPDLSLFFEEEEDLEKSSLLEMFQEHLQGFLVELEKYIPQHGYASAFCWVRNPFEISEDTILENEEDELVTEQLIDLQSRQLWKEKFKNLTLTKFWAAICAQEPKLKKLGDLATKALMPFPTTYLCEAGFSVLAILKHKGRSRLNPEDDMRCALTSIQPDIDLLAKELQAQGSH